jgi:hypothetical protein
MAIHSEDLQNLLAQLLDLTADVDFCEDEEIDESHVPSQITTFADAGVLTHDKGVVVRYDDGSEFQITIVRSR